jgi:aromatic ring-cleaving dioxygenase
MNHPTAPHINGYHAHIYFQPETRPAAEQIAETITGKFAVEIGGLFDKPVGPHPIGNLLVIFKPAEFAEFVPWLMFNRSGLDVLVHPLTNDAARDHDRDGLWLGTQVELKPHTHSRDYSPKLMPSA